MTNLQEVITVLVHDITSQQKTLEQGLLVLQKWFDDHIEVISEADRDHFSTTLQAEKDSATQDGKPVGDDSSLVASIMRLHAMRLLYRYDEGRREPAPLRDDTPYVRAKRKLELALRQTELALNEARVDTAIANAHNILNDPKANQRWLLDALTRLQTLSSKNLIRLAAAVPAPEPARLSFMQKIMFRLLNITQEEIGRRNLASLRQIAELQTNQLVEMVQLLIESFQANGDIVSSQQALALLGKIQTE